MDQHLTIRKSVFLILADMARSGAFGEGFSIVDGCENHYHLQVFDRHIKLDITRINTKEKRK